MQERDVYISSQVIESKVWLIGGKSSDLPNFLQSKQWCVA